MVRYQALGRPVIVNTDALAFLNSVRVNWFAPFSEPCRVREDKPDRRGRSEWSQGQALAREIYELNYAFERQPVNSARIASRGGASYQHRCEDGQAGKVEMSESLGGSAAVWHGFTVGMASCSLPF